MTPYWCEHLDKSSRYTLLTYHFDNREITLRVQTWICPECGVHGSATELVEAGESRALSKLA